MWIVINYLNCWCQQIPKQTIIAVDRTVFNAVAWQRDQTVSLNGTQTNDNVIVLTELSNPGEADQMSVCAFRREKKELDHRESCYLWSNPPLWWASDVNWPLLSHFIVYQKKKQVTKGCWVNHIWFMGDGVFLLEWGAGLRKTVSFYIILL